MRRQSDGCSMNPDHTNTGQPERMHDAFISYSRRDRAFALKLEKALENYKPPKEVRASGRRLSVFRDETDFSGIEYEASIAHHLKGSAKLIVICSPNARSSAYVADEIRRFAAINGAANIVPVLIEGLPNNEASPETEVRKAFPDVLCDLFRMPVALDYRGLSPGKERIDRGRFEPEWFKTLANLLDQEPAVVEQRERKRRTRSLRIAFLGAAMVIAVLTVSLVVTLISRREVVFQREQVQTTAAQADFDLALMYRRGSQTVDPRTLAHLTRALRTKPDAGLPRQYLVSLLRDVPWHLPLSAPMRHEREVIMAAFSPDGRRVVTASVDQTARLWNAESGEPIGQPMRHGGTVFAAGFSPDGTKILTRSEDGTARIWSASNAEPVGEVLRHEGAVLSAAFSPDGRWIVTGGSIDQTARLWEAENGRPVGEPLRHQGGVGTAVFSADSRSVFTASFVGHVQFWEVPSGRLLGTPLALGLGTVVEALSPDGFRILVQSVQGDAFRILDAQTGQPIGRPLHGGEPLASAAFTADGGRIVAVTAEGTAPVWDSKNGEPVGEPLHLDAGVMRLAFSPNGNQIVTISGDETARLRDARTGEPLGEPVRHDGRILNAAFSPDGARLVTTSADGTARVWSAESGGQAPLVLSHASTVVAAQFLGTRDRMLTVSSDGLVYAWAISTGQLLSRKRHPLAAFRDEVWEVAFSLDGGRIVMGFEDTARIWEFETGRWVGPPLSHPGEFKSVSFSPDGSQVITALPDNTARIWDVASGRPVGEPLRHEGGVALAAFSPDGRWIVTTGDDNTAWIWNARTQQLIHGPLRHPHEPGLGGSLEAAFSPDGRQLVTA